MATLYGYDAPRLALVRALPSSFSLALSEHPPESPIDTSLAAKQHHAYVDALRAAVGLVLEVEPADDCPDSCFIEDTIVVAGEHAVITSPGAVSRRPETKAVAALLRRLGELELELDLKTIRTHVLSDTARLDGGDVLYIGGQLFVGLSRRSNAAALAELTRILPCSVHGIAVDEGLHLKSVLSAMDDHTLVVADRPKAIVMANEIRAAARGDLQILTVPDSSAANVLRLGRTLLVQDGFNNSAAILEEAASIRGLELKKLAMSEFIKADGALTCCSVIIP